MNGSFSMVTPIYEVTADGATPAGWLRGMTFWADDSMPDSSSLVPAMYNHDLEEDEPPVGCDHDFPLEVEPDDGGEA